MTEAELAWLAGLFEGEGSIENIGTHGVRLTIAMTDRDVIDRVQRIVGAGTITVQVYDKPRDPGGAIPKPRHAWRLGGINRGKPLLHAMLPWLGVRRRKRAKEALARMSQSMRGGHVDRTHCSEGHELTPDKVYVPPRFPNQRRCRICINRRQAVYDAKRKAERNG